jgi:class 3 adenylate cyclase/tetratricopeptide (TPR) repeat protein
MRCHRCRHENPDVARFCAECGAPLIAVCASCGGALPDAAKFCPGCGAPAVAGANPSPPPPLASRRAPEGYTPAHLAEKILTSRAALEGERKQVTVLFCDVVGSTALAERLGAEAMHDLLSRFFKLALAAAHRYEGTINQFLGDGFMALFGAPIAHEDHAQRALLAAVDIREAVLCPLTLESGEPVRLAVRMGLHTGFVVVGAIGDNLRMDYTAVGDTTNLAARLQQMAAPGEILASEAVARLVEGHASLEPCGQADVRGRRAPVTVFKVVSASARRPPLDPVETRALSRFVGRARELETLQAFLDQVADGQGRLVGVVGEAGVGKSRLLAELRRVVEARSMLWREGRCLSYGATIPYLPLLDVLRQGCGVADLDTPEQVGAKLRATLDALGLGDDQAPYLLALLGVKEADDRLGGLGGDAIIARTFAALRQVLLRRSRRQPLVLAVEDLHWIDRTSEGFLESLADDVAGASILLVTTYRAGFRPAWMDRSYAAQIALGPLAGEDSLSVVRSVLPGLDASDPLAALIVGRAEGNPLFLEELAHAVEGDRDPRVVVPDTIHGVLTARIDRLAEAGKRLLQTAAVLGREFSARVLERLAETPATLDAELRNLARLEFLHRRPGADEPVYFFKHVLTQEVALGTLIARDRRALHRRAAEALAAVYPERERELAPVLTHHYLEAEAWSEAVPHARRAAEAASRAYANSEALARYDQALSAAERAGLASAELVSLLEARAAVHATLGEFDGAREDLDGALALAEGAGDRVAQGRVLGTLAVLWAGHRDYPQGLELARRAVVVLEVSGDRRALAEARARLGIIEANFARIRDSRQDLEEALRLYRELGDVVGEAQTLDMLGMNAWIGGHVTQARAHAEAALPKLREIGDRVTELSVVALLGSTEVFLRGWAAAEPFFQQALAMALATGAQHAEAFVHGLMAQFGVLVGRFGTVEREGRRGLALAREIGHREWTTMNLLNLGRLHDACGDRPGARGLLDEALALARELGAPIWIADALAALSRHCLETGDEALAERLATEVSETAGDTAFPLPDALRVQVELALRRGEPERALAAAARLREICGQYRLAILDLDGLEGHALRQRGRATEAEALWRATARTAADLDVLSAEVNARLALGELLATDGRVVEARSEGVAVVTRLERASGDLDDADLRRALEMSTSMRRARALAAAG